MRPPFSCHPTGCVATCIAYRVRHGLKLSVHKCRVGVPKCFGDAPEWSVGVYKSFVGALKWCVDVYKSSVNFPKSSVGVHASHRGALKLFGGAHPP